MKPQYLVLGFIAALAVAWPFLPPFTVTLLSYIGLFYIVHLEALKLGIEPMVQPLQRTLRQKALRTALGCSGTLVLVCVLYFVLEAAKALTLNTQGLNNSSGVITGAQLLLNTQGQQLNNAQGTLNASDTLTVDSGVLNNDGGIVQAKSSLKIDTHGQQLSNRNSGSTGGILGQRDVSVRAGQLLNDQGFIGSAATLELRPLPAGGTRATLVFPLPSTAA